MQNNIKELILNKYEERRLRNANYSLRSFAASIGIGSGAMTGIIQGKRQISKKMAERLAITLQLTKIDKDKFLSSFGDQQANISDSTKHHSLQTFELIAKWQYFALLSVLKIQNVKWDLSKIAKKMNSSESDCEQMLTNLLSLELIKVKNGRYFRARKTLEFADEVPSWAIKASHAESLELARKSIYEVPYELRDHSSITLAINKKNFKKAQKKIRQFQLEMAELLESGSKSEIYRLNVQLFPMLKKPGADREN